ncbi:regulator of nucleoside diphosphate kinase [Marinospirillum celere]|uniref:Regulator of nucleoside diphosphate kinase n=1 Tax=Marinospirillum celere TaxID=1122252 RepID=A0A1I1IRA4_9GAMM|nr:nucleoside diphosphate kinase regulator [Marinospirillum celere]SFC38789.1 regulator of nucleoside diphosphate kinase [Marinospirillum celere]
MLAKLHLLMNELDHARLERLVDSPEYNKMPVAQALAERLDNADIAAPEEIPADLVSMHSRIRFRDLKADLLMEKELVYPHNLKQDATDQLSVMAPLGAALLGARVGEEVHWQLPNGKDAALMVEEILYQPEQAGELYR